MNENGSLNKENILATKMFPEEKLNEIINDCDSETGRENQKLKVFENFHLSFHIKFQLK